MVRNSKILKKLDFSISRGDFLFTTVKLGGYGDENQVRGLETWVYSRNSEIYPAALKIHQNVFNIYPYKNGDRGVRLGLDEDHIIREINPLKVNHGVLIELGFHDNYKDALWVVQNIDLIGETIGNSIAEYFGK